MSFKLNKESFENFVFVFQNSEIVSLNLYLSVFKFAQIFNNNTMKRLHTY